MYYYYHTIESHGNLIDFYLSPNAEIFLRKSISTAGCKPDKIVTDKDMAYPVELYLMKV